MNVTLSLRPPVIWGGIFSQFMLMIPNAIHYDVEGLNMDVNDGYNICNDNPFDWVFDQTPDNSYIIVPCKHHGIYTNKEMKRGGYLGAIEDSASFDKMKDICSRIRIKQEILDIVNKYSSLLSPNTLGVHVRLGEMNTIHPQYGIASTRTYIDKINEINPDSVFLASDNDTSIRMIKESVSCEVIVIENLAREEIDNISVDNVHMNLLYKDYYWREVFTDMLVLSRCNELLCRVSNFANATILFSNSFNKIHRLI